MEVMIYHMQNWNLDFEVKKLSQGSAYKKIANRITESLNFMNAFGINSTNSKQIYETDFYISHEALLTPHETSFGADIVLQVIGTMFRLICFG